MRILISFLFQRKIAILFVILMAILFMFFSQDYGISGDERFYEPYGKSAWNFYKTLGRDTSALFINTGDGGQLHCYGPSIDLFSEIVADTFRIEDKFMVRHIFASFSLILIVVFCGLLTYLLTNNTYISLFTCLLVILSPRLFGDSMNNLKDPSYAAFNIISVYYIIRFVKELPNPKRNTIIGLILGIGMTLGSRIGGLLLFAYLGLFSLIAVLLNKELKSKVFGDSFKPLLKTSIVIVFCSYILGIVFWPFGLVSPIENPLHALDFFTNQTYQIKTLFQGEKLSSMEIPWFYVFKWISISVPEVIIFGFLLFIILSIKYHKEENFKYLLMVLFTFLFPIVYIIYKKSGMYNAWRHTTFLYPSFVVISSVGFYYVFLIFKNKIARIVFGAFIAIGLLFPLRFMIMNHPFQSVYFNNYFGGVKNAVGYYETDYFGVSIRKATEWLIENKNKNIENSNIAINYPPLLVDNYMQKMFPKKNSIYVRFGERDQVDWDYYIITHQLISEDLLKNEVSFPPKGTIKTIDIDGVPICAIVKKEDKNDYYGKKALDSNQFAKAIEYLNKAIQYDNKNEIAWTNLGMAQLQSGQVAASIESFKKSLVISPENLQAMNGLAYAYLNINEVNYAKMTLETMIELNPNYAPAYDLLSKIYANQGNSQMAQQYSNFYRQLTGN
jgi:tetratricopeptide (TPR) repeat protein